MLPHTGSTIMAAMSRRCAANDRLERVHVVERQDEGVGHRARGHARRAGNAEGGDPRARGHQQAVGVAVVAAVELDDLAAAR